MAALKSRQAVRSPQSKAGFSRAGRAWRWRCACAGLDKDAGDLGERCLDLALDTGDRRLDIGGAAYVVEIEAERGAVFAMNFDAGPLSDRPEPVGGPIDLANVNL